MLGKTIILIGIFILGFSSAAYPEESQIELHEYIENLRQQFIQLSNKGDKEKLPLYISPIEVELITVVVKEGSAGVKFYVFDAGGKYQNSGTQKLKFTITLGNKDGQYMTWRPIDHSGQREWTTMMPVSNELSKDNTKE